jgi:PIN domain nuclease of toxin-antitoxin system
MPWCGGSAGRIISCWEVALLVAKGRLDLDRDVSLWVTQALEIPKVRLLDLSPAIAIASTRLEWIHDDRRIGSLSRPR